MNLNHKKKLKIFAFVFLLFFLASNFASNFILAAETKTIKFFVGQENNSSPDNAITSFPFSITITDNLPTSEKFKSVFFEIKGIANASPGLVLSASIDQIAQDPTLSPNLASYNLGAISNNTHFKILYDATNYFNTVPGLNPPGTFNFVLNLKNVGGSISLWQSKIILTYTPSKYPPFAELTSPIFDTETTGAGYNSLYFIGLKPIDTRVKFQLATSNSSTGPWTAGDFLGPDCTFSTYYEPTSDIPEIINCEQNHNNKRYFRYKVRLESNPNRDQTPTIYDIIINWSP